MIELLNLLSMAFIVLAMPPLFLRLIPKVGTGVNGQALLKDDRGRVIFFDMARGVAMLAVILIHVIYLYPGTVVQLSQVTLDVLNNSLRFAIAIFFIASGALLTPPARTKQALLTFYRDKLVRLAIPYVVVVTVLSITAHHSFSTFTYNLVTGNASVPFYFIIVLFQFYLLYPWIEQWAKKRIFVFGTLVFTLIIAMFPILWSWYGIPIFFRYLFFFVWGVYMRESLLNGSASREWWPWFTIIALYFGLQALVGIDNFYNVRPYYGVAILMMLYVLSARECLPEKLNYAFAWIGRLSLWIFLTHFTLLQWLLPTLAEQGFATGWVLFISGSLLAIMLCIGFAYLCGEIYGGVTRRIGKFFG